ncbi:alpha-L-fucosidase [Flagellimonas aequoris]|uniref:alpha-L-fucosidase n=1 Tax=Flagellimonas aequoris TaxID=2306997 RepID=A0A418N7R2_9FLAO|nr:alpha-L-fucosidase [Allomuricauda aequoris]RIV71169.1 glycoside hydrolase family 29 [Allomuricauda aequoris]TXK02543.1 alpha-L-fucosidase [Allomuricauda aequoris]
MHRYFQLFFAFLILAGTACKDKGKVPPPQPLGPLPTSDQLAWHQMELNAFVHFSINTFTDREWGYGDESPDLFDPSGFNADQWMATLKEAGFKGIILTAKHHDGFALWPTAYTDHSVANSPFNKGNGDVVKEVSEAAARYGLKFGVYLSPWDRNGSDYGQASYVQYYRNQLKELFTGYGPIFEMWFDGANGGDGFYGGAREKRAIDGEHYYDWPNTLKIVDSMQPNVLFFSDAGPDIRWVGNERGIAGETNWNTITPDTLYAGKAGIEDLLQQGTKGGSHWIPAEVDVSIRPGWFYHQAQDSLVRSAENLFQLYLTSVGRGSNLLLNVPPDRRGLFHEKDVASLQGFKRILDSVFNKNIATDSRVTASSFRGNDETYAPTRMIDNDEDTYWSTDNGVTQASFELDFGSPKVLNYLLLQEYIQLGQRVAAFDVFAWEQGSWNKIASETTIGYKRILPMGKKWTSRLKVVITESLGCPVLSNVEVY